MNLKSRKKIGKKKKRKVNIMRNWFKNVEYYDTGDLKKLKIRWSVSANKYFSLKPSQLLILIEINALIWFIFDIISLPLTSAGLLRSTHTFIPIEVATCWIWKIGKIKAEKRGKKRKTKMTQKWKKGIKWKGKSGQNRVYIYQLLHCRHKKIMDDMHYTCNVRFLYIISRNHRQNTPL